MKRRIKIAALIVGLLVVVLLTFLAWVLYTEAGLRFAVARLPERLGKSMTLKVGNVHGTIAGGFGADIVEIGQELSDVRVEQGSARVNIWPLLAGRISVREAHADLVQVQVKRRLRPKPKTPPRFLPRLLSIAAERAHATTLLVIATNGKRVEFNDVSAAGIVGHKSIKVFESSIIYGVLRGRAIGELRAGDPMKLRGEATTRMLIEGQPGWRADASFDGTLDKLPLTAKLQEPFRADMRGELLTLSSAFHWVGKADVYNFDMQAFGGGSALGIITGKLDVGGEMNAFHARGPLQVPGLGAGPFDIVFEGNYADRVVNATHYEITHKATRSHAEGQGTIETAQNGPKLLLHGDWRGLRWPLVARFTAETPQIFSSPQGKYRLEGLWPYAISASGDLFIPQLDPMTVAMRGALHKDHLQIDELDLGAFGGEALLAGEARWSPAESWALEGSVKGFNPAALRKGFNGALDFNMKASGAPFGADGDLDFAFSHLTGKLRGSAATGSGRVALHGEDWTFDSLRFRAGNTSLAIDGELGQKRALDLTFSLDADNLALIAEGARGELHARGSIGGTYEAPVIKLTAQGNDIESGTIKVDKLATNIDLDWRGQRTSHADIAISRLSVDKRSLTQFNATLDGTTADHVVRADALAGKTSLHLSGKGGFADGVWKGTIGDLFIDDTANINLQLDTPVKLVASAKSFKLDALCMHGKIARLCGEAAWNEGGWTARADAQNLPISTLTAGLTPNVEYQGSVNATARASATAGAAFIGEARADLIDAGIKHKLASGRTDVITFGSGFVTSRPTPAR